MECPRVGVSGLEVFADEPTHAKGEKEAEKEQEKPEKLDFFLSLDIAPFVRAALLEMGVMM